MIALGKLLACLLAAQSGDAAVWRTAVAKANNAGDVIILRYMGVAPSDATRARFGTKATLTWKYEGSRGLPSSEERARMDALEDVLQSSIEPSSGMLVIVTTGEGTRQWTYYASSGDDFLGRMNNALKGKPEVPAKVEIKQDPGWSAYEEFMSKVARSGG